MATKKKESETKENNRWY